MATLDTPWKAKVLTLFPDMFPGPLGLSLAGQGLKNNAWKLECVDIRDYAEDKHRTVDDTPFGGGPGMVMRPDVASAAIDDAMKKDNDLTAIYLTPRGQPLTQTWVRELADGPGVMVLCGRYEGLDERVLDAHDLEEISLGDFILSGGETAAMSMLDACVRLLPGIIGSAESLDDESFEDNLLEYPQYTRPQDWNGRAVPDVLVSGHHEKIKAWRREQAEAVTRQRRPDLWARHTGNNV